VCVSRDYKDSGNCRMECKYAKALEAAGRLKIVYLMMEEDFTTTSETAIGGWLRLYMEDALWYQCWDDELVEEAAGKVTRVLEEREGKVEREKREAGEEKAALAEAREVTGAAAAAFSALAPEVVAWLTHNKLEALLPVLTPLPIHRFLSQDLLPCFFRHSSALLPLPGRLHTFSCRV